MRKYPAQEFLKNTVYDWQGEDCLIWPFHRNRAGYATGWVDGKYGTVSRLLCKRVHGQPPTPRHEAAHSCGKGHLGCVNPRHLRWATSSENKLDCRNHGTDRQGVRSALAKLNDDQVRAIVALYGKGTQREIAARFSVHKHTVSRIHRGIGWPYIERPHLKRAAPLTIAQLQVAAASGGAA